MIKHFYYYILAIIFTALTLQSCEEVKGEPEEFTKKQKTLLVYMAANNNLCEDAKNNLSSMMQGYIPDEEGNLVAYYHYPNQNPLLLHIKHNEDGNAAIDTIYRFPSRNSATAASLTSAINVTATYFPADEYGLILWSHATGWLPVNYYANNPQSSFISYPDSFSLNNIQSSGYENGIDPYAHIIKMVKNDRNGILSRSFGSEENSEIDIKDVAKALPFKFSFIIFDACLMGGIETAYQLKDSTDYLLFSPTETLAEGMPYASIMRHIFATPTDLTSVAKEYYNHYNNKSYSRYATISLVKTSELDNVANAAKDIFGKYRDSISTIKINAVQRYFRYNKHWFYDINDFISQLAPTDEAAVFAQALEKAVIYKAATKVFIDIPINSYSGLSTYIPYFNETELNNYYKTLEWNKVCGMVE